MKYLDKGKEKHVAISILLGGITIYFSPTNFVFHIIIWSYILIFYNYNISFFKKFVFLLFFGFIHLVLITPYFYFFVFKTFSLNLFNIVKEENLSYYLSLNLNDLYQTLPEHFLYFLSNVKTNYPWLDKIKSAYIGIFFYVSLFLGLYFVRKSRFWVGLFLIGLIVAIGPFVGCNNHKFFPFFMYPFYEYLNFDNYIRVPIRYFSISIFAGTIVIAYFFKYLQVKNKNGWLVFLFLLIMMDNVPLKMEKYTDEQKVLFIADDKAFEYLKNKDSWNQLLFLPSALFTYNGDRNEYIYMYWQQYFHKNIINGNVAFLPQSRMKVKTLIDNFDTENLQSLIHDYHLDAVVFAKNIANEKDYNLVEILDKDEKLERIFENQNFIIFETQN